MMPGVLGWKRTLRQRAQESFKSSMRWKTTERDGRVSSARLQEVWGEALRTECCPAVKRVTAGGTVGWELGVAMTALTSRTKEGLGTLSSRVTNEGAKCRFVLQGLCGSLPFTMRHEAWAKSPHFLHS